MSAEKTPVRILVADDQAINRKLTLRQLERLGFTADSVENGLEALEVMTRERYDLVFMDCHMPRMDGFRATEELRRREGSERHTPVVALTASATGADRRRFEEVGMDDCVTKPVSEAELVRILNRWVAHEHPAIEIAAAPDGRVLDDMIDLYLADAPQRMEAIRKAVARRNSKALVSAAHALKSGSAHVGATRVCEICEELESIGRAGVATGAAKMAAALELAYARAERALREMRR